MSKPERDKATKRQVACEAALLLTEAIRELTIPQHLITWINKLEAAQQVSEDCAAAVHRTAMASIVIGVYRVSETRQHFLVPWLFCEDKLLQLGLLSIEHFVRDRAAFQMVRSQWAAHARAKKSTNRQPGRLIDASALGRALEKTGVGDEDRFLKRVRNELIPAVEKVRDNILKIYPEAREFITKTYPDSLRQGAIDEENRS